MSDTIRDRVSTIVCDQLDLQSTEIEASKNLADDLGADSLAIVELVLAIEEEFQVKIPDADVESLRTIGDVVCYIKKKAA